MSQPQKQSRLVLFWQRRPFLLAGLIIAIALTTFFGARTYAFYASLHAPKPHLVEPWMRPRYIARAFDLNRNDVMEALGLQKADSPLRSMSIAQIARKTNSDVDELIDEIENLIDQRRKQDRP